MPRKKPKKKTSRRVVNRRRAKGKVTVSNVITPQLGMASMPTGFAVQFSRRASVRSVRIPYNGVIREGVEISGFSIYANVIQGTGTTPGAGCLIGNNNSLPTIATSFNTSTGVAAWGFKDITPIPSGTAYRGGLPDNSMEAVISGTFNRYRYTKLILRYQPRLPTNVPGGVCIGYFADPAVLNNGSIALNQMIQLPTVMTTPSWAPCAVDVTPSLDLAFKYVHYAGGSLPDDSDCRFYYDGAILGSFVDFAPTSTAFTFHGFVWFEYVIQLIEPTIFNNIVDGGGSLVSTSSALMDSKFGSKIFSDPSEPIELKRSFRDVAAAPVVVPAPAPPPVDPPLRIGRPPPLTLEALRRRVASATGPISGFSNSDASEFGKETTFQ